MTKTKTTIPAKQANNRANNNGSLTQFKAGVSGNPKGRPPVGKSIAELVRTIGNEVLDEQRNWTRIDVLLRKLYQDANNGKHAAAQIILDRGWGNVPQPIGGSDELGPIQIEAVEAYSFDAAVAAIAFRPDTNSTD